ncbi:hypothetical protein KBD20_01585 [Candidatus Saccharibacteria bacterium]|nr:hypothetical protein [Candidatus Saccharibacteria bacterium]
MSQEKSDFEVAYNEAFVSGTGFEFDPQSDDYEEFVTNFLDKPGDEPYIPFLPKYEISVLKHPYAITWQESDYREQARIAYFGRCLIETAKRSLASNPLWQTESKKDGLLYQVGDFLQFARWVEQHPEDLDPDRSANPDVASPLRFVDWPYGEHINCLGQSIALAAAAELNGTEFVYANELSVSTAVVAEQHLTLAKEVEKISPYFFEDESNTQRLLNFMDIIRGSERYKGVLSGFNTSAIQSVDELRDFHHFILTREKEIIEDEDGFQELHITYEQLDPYALTAGVAYVDGDDIIEDILVDPENVVVIDSHDAIYEAFRDLNRAVKKAKQLITRNRKFTGGVYSEDLTAGVREICLELLDGDKYLPFDADFTPDVYLSSLERMLRASLDSLRVEAACGSELATKLLQMRYNIIEATQEEFTQLDVETQSKIIKLEKNNTNAAAAMRNVGNELPLAMVMQVYTDMLHFVWDVKNWGTACSAMELADPELMIGAMYLNHYASHRKDGRINVARYLVRYTASQLIWQAAQLDGESAEDPSLEAVGELVARLPSRQHHPRLALNLRTPVPQL